MGCKNCKCKNKTNQKDYNEKKALLKDKILGFEVINYMNEDEQSIYAVEVQFDDYILEIDNFENKDINLDTVIEHIVNNSLVHF